MHNSVFDTLVIKMSLEVNVSEPDEFNCNELHSCIDEVAKLTGLEDFVYHVDFVSGNGGNFTSNVFRILITEANSDKEYSFIVKTLLNTERQELFHELHEREVNVYRNVLNKYEEIQEVLDVEDRAIFPKCEFTRIELSKDVIILEDMKAKGFESNALANGLNYEQASTAIKELAKFHALSLIYEKQDAESFETAKSEFQDIVFSDEFLSKNNKLGDYFYDSFGKSLELVVDLQAKYKLGKIQSKLLDLLKMYTRPRKNNVLCHGDYWINNIMFKHEENKNSKVCFIDFQAMRYSSPVTDIFFLFLGTDSTFRSTYFNDLTNGYYDNLKSFLGLYNIDVNSVYKKEDFDRDCVDLLPFGFLIDMIYMRLVIHDQESDVSVIEESRDLENEKEGTTGEKRDSNFIVRVNDLMNDCTAKGILDTLIDTINSLEYS